MGMSNTGRSEQNDSFKMRDSHNGRQQGYKNELSVQTSTLLNSRAALYIVTKRTDKFRLKFTRSTCYSLTFYKINFNKSSIHLSKTFHTF